MLRFCFENVLYVVHVSPINAGRKYFTGALKNVYRDVDKRNDLIVDKENNIHIVMLSFLIKTKSFWEPLSQNSNFWTLTSYRSAIKYKFNWRIVSRSKCQMISKFLDFGDCFQFLLICLDFENNPD